MAVNSKKKLLGRALLIVVGVFMVLGAVYFVFFLIQTAQKNRNAKLLDEMKNDRQSYNFFEPDYELNIFDDADYVNKNREFSYTEDPLTIRVGENDITSLPEPAQFLYEYLQHAINGEADELNAMYSDFYWESHEKLDRFTMQKIYDIEAEFISNQEMDQPGGKVLYTEYRLGYRIKNNNGTFRNDQPEDSIVSQWVQIIITSDGTMRINDIQKYSVYLASQQLS